jgi:hypothetical protein
LPLICARSRIEVQRHGTRAHAILEAKFYKRELQPTIKKVKPEDKTEISGIDAPPVSKELKKRWSYFIRKVIETDQLICPKCQGEIRRMCTTSPTSITS